MQNISYYLFTDLDYDAVRERQNHLSIDKVDLNFKGGICDVIVAYNERIEL
jgi:hypothetical protein